MLPIIVDVKGLSVAVIGGGVEACRRLRMLDEAGVQGVKVYAPRISAEMKALAGGRLVERDIKEAELKDLSLVFVANVSDGEAVRLVSIARASKTLINVEDVKLQCDFHVPALVRRGDLLLTASSGGRSPTLARRLKGFLSARFSSDWQERVDELGALREGWRAAGLSFRQVAARSDALIDERGWLECRCPLKSQSDSKAV